MAKQKGALQLEGRIGELIFYKNKEGEYCVQGAAGPSREDVLHGPAFANSRKNMSEFALAARSASALRKAVVAAFGSDGYRVHRRFTTAILRCIKNDTTGAWGERTLTAGAMQLLAGFEWNTDQAAAPLMGATATVNGNTLTVSAARPQMPGGKRDVVPALVVLGFQPHTILEKGGITAVDQDRASSPSGAGVPFSLSCQLPQSGCWIAVVAYADVHPSEMPLMIIAAGGV